MFNAFRGHFRRRSDHENPPNLFVVTFEMEVTTKIPFVGFIASQVDHGNPFVGFIASQVDHENPFVGSIVSPILDFL